MNAFSVVLTIAVLAGVALLIILFERKRARQIEHDLRGMADDPAGETRSSPPE